MRAIALAVTPLLASTAFAQERIPAPPEDRSYVGVVIGLSTYQNLPDEVELDFSRSDAALVAKSMEEQGHFSKVFLLTDTEATKAAISDTLRTKVAQLVGPEDVLVLYFAGHGLGADLELPTLLAYDSTLENGHQDGFPLDGFAQDLETWLKAGTTVIVTDAIHHNQLDGIYFYGPAANQWPKMRDGTMLLSSSQAQQPAKDGVFGKIFAAAISGAADANDDTWVTAAELASYTIAATSAQGQTPVVAGAYNGYTVLAEDVDRSQVAGIAGVVSGTVYPDVTVDKAKFVFSEGAGQTVKCTNKPVMTCDPSCYVWEFPAGPCEVTAVIDGVPMKGKIVILARGKYDCRRQGPELSCSGPG